MIKLTIYKEDKSVYWVSYFNTMDECNAWLEVEKTRPYWVDSYYYAIEDHTAPPVSEAEKEQIKDREEKRVKSKVKLKAILSENNLKLEAIEEALKHLINLTIAD